MVPVVNAGGSRLQPDNIAYRRARRREGRLRTIGPPMSGLPIPASAERAILDHESTKSKSAHLSCCRRGYWLANWRNQLAWCMVCRTAEADIQSSELGVRANLDNSVCDDRNRGLAHLPAGGQWPGLAGLARTDGA